MQVRALEVPSAAGRRFLLTAGAVLSMLEVAEVLRDRLGESAAAGPTAEAVGPPSRARSW